MQYQNLTDMFFRRAADFAGKPRYRVKRDGRWVEVSWDEHARAARDDAARDRGDERRRRAALVPRRLAASPSRIPGGRVERAVRTAADL